MKRVIVVVCLMLLLSFASACAPHAQQGATPNPPAAASTQRLAPAAAASMPLPISPESADAAEPAVASGRDGTAFLAWVEHREKMKADVMLARLDRAGQPSGTPVRVNPREGETTAWRGDAPTLAVAPDGALYVGWTARVEGTRHANNLYLSVSRDEGRTFAPPVKINDDRQPADRGMHSLAVSPTDGRIHVAWLDERHVAPPPHQPSGAAHGHKESNREVFTAFSTDGGQTFSPNKVVAREACPCCKTTLVAASDGRVYASWRQVLPGDFRHIAVASSADGGQTYNAPAVVSDDRWMLEGCPVSGAAMAVADDGALRVLWYSEGAAGARGLYWSESRDGGQTFAPRRLFADGMTRGTPTLLRAGLNQFTAIWEANDGTTLHPATAQLAADGNITPIIHISNDGELPAATATRDGFLIAYVAKTNDRRRIYLASR